MSTPPPEYDVRGYGAMQADAVRMRAYADALRAVVTPESVVLDIGTGAGVIALLAARMGARRVIGVEPAPVIEMARRNASACGLADRIEFIEDDSRKITLPERADVIVTDLRGILPLHRDNLAVIADARERHLAPGGTLIPLRDELLVAPVSAPEEYARITDAWRVEGFDLAPARAASLNEWRRAALSADGVIGRPKVWATLDYATAHPSRFEGGGEWVVEAACEGHGAGAWFRTELVPGVGFSTAPDAPRTIYGGAFFPWPRAVDLLPGDRVSVELSAHAEGPQPIWIWRTRVEREGAAPISFVQSPVLASPPSLRALHRRADSYRPSLGVQGRAAALVLEAAAEGCSLAEIADRLMDRTDGLFPRRVDAQTFAAELMDRYGD